MIDIEAIKGRIADGICGDDRLTGAEVFDALAALNALVAEVERLRGLLLDAGWPALAIAEVSANGAAQERAATVDWLRDCALDPETTGAEMRLLQGLASCIERGDHVKAEP